MNLGSLLGVLLGVIFWACGGLLLWKGRSL